MPLAEQQTTSRISLRNVMFATDFSTCAQAALPYAVAISRHYGSTLHAVHVIPDFNILVHPQAVDPITFESAYEAEKRAALDQMRSVVPDLQSIDHHTYIRHGDVWDALSEIMFQKQIDLLVLGTHGRSGLGKLIMGSVAEELVRQAPCPVLTIGPKVSCLVKEKCFDEAIQDIRLAEIELKQIIFAVDFNPESLAAAPFAISLAEEFQAGLALIYVMPQDLPTPSRLVLQRLEGLVPQEAALWCRPENLVKFGTPADEILECASERNADLIVLGVRSAKAHLGSATHFPWSTAHKVIASASCPVLTVRS
jgi:nucleotide-binding universal stress UspA family protein